MRKRHSQLFLLNGEPLRFSDAEFIAKQEAIPEFPTPGRVISKIKSSPEKMKMLRRLYAKYMDLCSFAHGLAEANLLKMMCNNRSPRQKLSSDATIKKNYQSEVVGEAYITSFFSIAQCTAELTTLYPGDMEIVAVASRAWELLSIASLMTKAIWEIRTRKLLGALA